MKSSRSVFFASIFTSFCLLGAVPDLEAQSGSNLGGYGENHQPGLLTGQVTRGGNPVNGATIVTIAGHSTQTDGAGAYQIHIGAPGLYAVTASSLGDSKAGSAEIYAGQTTVLDFQFAQVATWTLNVGKTGSGAGTVTSNPSGIDCGSSCSAQFAQGMAVVLTAVADTGSAFAGWSGGGCSGSGTCTMKLTADTTVSAEFVTAPPQEHELSISKNGTGSGTVSSLPVGIDCGSICSANFPAGSKVNLSAVAAPGSVFNGWSGGGCSGSGACQVTLSSDTTVTATFDQAPAKLYTLSVTKDGTGSGSISSSPPGIDCGPTCSFDFAESTEVTLSASPAAGSYFAGWSGAGCSGTNDCSVKMVAGKQVSATFNMVLTGYERPIPTLNAWGIILLSLLLFVVSLRLLRKTRPGGLAGLFLALGLAGWYSCLEGAISPGYQGLSYPEPATLNIWSVGETQVNSWSGNVLVQRGLLSVPARGIPASIYLSYNSDARNVKTHYGFGWNLSYNIRYTEDAVGNVTIVWGDGRQDRFAWGGSNFTAPPGVYLTLSEPAAGQLALRNKHGVLFRFADATHRKLTSIQDPNGNSLTLAYDGAHRLVSITTAGGRTYGFAYDGSGRLVQVTDPNLGGRNWQLGYDASDRLVQLTDPLGNIEAFAYDGENLLTGMTDARGHTAAIAYMTPAWDASTRLPQTVSKAGSTTAFAFDTMSRTTTVTTPRGYGWDYRYDLAGRLVEIEDPDGNSAMTAWDANRNPIQVTDRKGNTTTFTYDAQGNLLTMTDPLGNVTSWAYEPNFNWISASTDPSGNTWASAYDGSGNRLTITDPLGNSTQYAYDGAGQLTSQTDPSGNVTQFSYDAFGNTLGVTNALGATSSFQYDGANRTIQATDPKGNTSKFAYDLTDRLTESKDPAGYASTYSYDARGNLTSVTDRDGNTSVFVYDGLDRNTGTVGPLGTTDSRIYDPSGNLTSYTDGNGNVFQYSFDALDRLGSQLDPLGNSDRRSYDASDNLVEYEDFRGNKTAFGYDPLNRPTTVTDALGHVFTRKYDANGNVIETVDPNGNKTTYAYDTTNRVVSLTNALGGTEVRAYDPNGHLTEYTDFRGNKSSFSYNAVGQRIAVTDPLGNSQTYHYDPNGNLQALTNQVGDTTAFAYDAMNRLLSVTDPLGNADLRTYSPSGLLTTVTDPLGHVRTFTYDALGRLISETDGRGNADTYVYDPEGNLLSYTDREGNLTQFSYDPLNRPVAQTDALGNTDTREYDANGNLVTYTDRRGNQWTRAYDALNRDIGRTNPLGQSWQNAFDPAGRLISRTDAEGQTTAFEYDAIGRLTKQVFDDASEALFTYDANGNLLTVVDPVTDYGYAYDVRNQKTSYTDNKLTKTVLYSYDAAGRLATKTDPAGNVLTYAYDAAGNLVTLTDPGGASTMSYDDAGNLILNQRPVQVRSAFSYDANHQPILVTHYDDLATALDPILHRQEYTRDKLGRIVRTDITYYDVTQTVHYTYDALGRVTQERSDSSSGGIFPVSFEANIQYDANGNRTFLDYTDRQGNNTQDTLVYDVANRPISDTSAAGVVNYVYDANGSRIQKTYNGSVDTYGYDVRNRMVSYQAAAMPAAKNYHWDALNKLVGFRYGGLVEDKIMYASDTPIWQSSGFGLDETLFASFADGRPSGSDEIVDVQLNSLGFVSDGLAFGSVAEVEPPMLTGNPVSFVFSAWTQQAQQGYEHSAPAPRVWYGQFGLSQTSSQYGISSISDSDGHRYTLSDGRDLNFRSNRYRVNYLFVQPEGLDATGPAAQDALALSSAWVELSEATNSSGRHALATVSDTEVHAVDIHWADASINFDSVSPPCVVKWREGLNVLDTRRPEAMWLPGTGAATFFDNDLESFGLCRQKPYATGFGFSNGGWASVYDPYTSRPTSFGLAGNVNPMPTDRMMHSFNYFNPANRTPYAATDFFYSHAAAVQYAEPFAQTGLNTTQYSGTAAAERGWWNGPDWMSVSAAAGTATVKQGAIWVQDYYATRGKIAFIRGRYLGGSYAGMVRAGSRAGIARSVARVVGNKAFGGTLGGSISAWQEFELARGEGRGSASIAFRSAWAGGTGFLFNYALAPVAFLDALGGGNGQSVMNQTARVASTLAEGSERGMRSYDRAATRGDYGPAVSYLHKSGKNLHKTRVGKAVENIAYWIFTWTD